MVRSCKFCHKPYQQLINEGVSFHKFPKDAQLKEKWCEILRLQTNKINKYSELCSTHFTSDQFKIRPKRKYLKKHALPEIQFLLPDIPVKTDPSDYSTSTTLQSIPVVPSRFPKDESIRRKWFQNIGFDYEETKYIYLCSDHFSEKCFIVKYSGHRYLDKGAVPTITCGRGVQQEKISRQEILSPAGCSTVSVKLSPVSNESPDSPSEIYVRQESLSPSRFSTVSVKLSPVSSPPPDSPAEIPVRQESLSPTGCSTVSDELSPVPSESPGSPLQIIVVSQSPSGLSPETVDPPQKSPTETDSCRSSPFDEVEQNSSSTITLTDPEYDCDDYLPDTLKRKRFAKPRYFGDCNDADMSNSIQAARNWKIAKKTIYQQRKKIQQLQRNNRRLKMRIECMKSLMTYIFKK